MICFETYVTLCNSNVCNVNMMTFQRPGFGRNKGKACQFWILVVRQMYSLDSLVYTITILFIFTILCVYSDIYLYFDKHGKPAILICML